MCPVWALCFKGLDLECSLFWYSGTSSAYLGQVHYIKVTGSRSRSLEQKSVCVSCLWENILYMNIVQTRRENGRPSLHFYITQPFLSFNGHSKHEITTANDTEITAHNMGDHLLCSTLVFQLAKIKSRLN